MGYTLQQIASLIVCLTLSFAGQSANANAQGRNDAPVGQINLTEAQVTSFIAAQPDIARFAGKVQGSGGRAPAIKAELDSIANKHGFSSFGELDEVAANISIVMAGLNPDTGEYNDPVVVMKEELENVKRDKSISGEEKRHMVDELVEAIELSPAVLHSRNIELVRAHRKAIARVLE